LYILYLLDHISKEAIETLKGYPEVLTFFVNEFYKNVNCVSYQYKDNLLKMLLSINEVRENPNAWYGLDIDQIEIYKTVSDLLMYDFLNYQIVNIRNLYSSTIKENIINNINAFKDNPKLLCVMPLMLDCDDNKYILDILIKNGLDINDLRGFNSTIFCIPVKLVEVIEKLFAAGNIPMILDNKVHPFVYEVILMIRDNFNKNVIIRGRRVPFYKSLLAKEFNVTNNPVIDELSYEDYESEISKEILKSTEAFNDVIKDMTTDQVNSYVMRVSRRAQDFIVDRISKKLR